MLYESILLFGVLFAAILLFLLATKDRIHEPIATIAMNMWYVFVLGAYFIYFWLKSGQTLAMQTWRIKVISADGSPVTFARALLRYLAAWMWFLPAFLTAYVRGIHHWPMVALVIAGFSLWACTALLDKHRQFLHDRIAGTRLVTAPPRETV